MPATWLRKAASLISGLLVAVIDHLNPVLGIVAKLVRHLVTAIRGGSRHAVEATLPDINLSSLSEELATDLVAGIVADAIEVGSTKESIEWAVPSSAFVVRCSRCGTFSHYYVQIGDETMCKRCLLDELDQRVSRRSRIFCLQNQIQDLREQMARASGPAAMPGPSGFPRFPQKYAKLKGRYRPDG